MNTEDKIKVMQHYAAGGKVKVKENRIDGHECIRQRDDPADQHDLTWNWADNTYFIIEEPERIWLHVIILPSDSRNPNGKLVEMPVLDKHKEEYQRSWKEAGYTIVSVTPFVKEDSK